MGNKNQILTKPPIVCDDYCRDKYGHRYCVAKCPFCNNFFTSRVYSIENGHTKSCGCWRRRRKSNTYYFPVGCDYGIGFYDNTDGFFVFDLEKYNIISKHHWTDRNADGRHEPITSIDGKTTSMARFLMKTPAELVPDHINGKPNDNRIENLRNCTPLENNQNKHTVKKDNEALSEYSFEKSQEIARKIETYEFDEISNSFCFLGVLEEIQSLPERNVYKRILRNICRDKLKGILSEDQEEIRFLKLIEEYKREYKVHQ